MHVCTRFPTHLGSLKAYAQTLLFASRAPSTLLFDCFVEKKRSGSQIEVQKVEETLKPPKLPLLINQRRGCPTPTAIFHESVEKQSVHCSGSKKQSLCIGLQGRWTKTL